MIVIAFYCPLVVLEADVVKTGKGGTVDVRDLVIGNKKELLETKKGGEMDKMLEII